MTIKEALCLTYIVSVCLSKVLFGEAIVTKTGEEIPPMEFEIAVKPGRGYILSPI